VQEILPPVRRDEFGQNDGDRHAGIGIAHGIDIGQYRRDERAIRRFQNDQTGPRLLTVSGEGGEGVRRRRPRLVFVWRALGTVRTVGTVGTVGTVQVQPCSDASGALPRPHLA
jgi:hypothetical protein